MKIGLIWLCNMAHALASRWARKHDLHVGGCHVDKARRWRRSLATVPADGPAIVAFLK
jgi:hypothetical protein